MSETLRDVKVVVGPGISGVILPHLLCQKQECRLERGLIEVSLAVSLCSSKIRASRHVLKLS